MESHLPLSHPGANARRNRRAGVSVEAERSCEYVAFGITNSFIYIIFAINTNDSNTLNTNISYTINTNMATMQEKMAESLAALKAYQDAHGDNLVIHGADVLGRTHTERLVDAGYLTMVLRGWYIPSFPGSEGDSTGMSRIGLLSLLISTASLMVVGVFLQNCLYIIIVERV